MNKTISEENPAPQAQAQAPQGQGAGGGQDKIRKQARQLAYDVRYKVKQGFKEGQKSDPASLKRAYMSQLGKSPAPGPVKLLAKKMLIGESYDFVDITETVNKSVSTVIDKVFVKTIEVDDADGNPAFEITDLMVKESSGEKKYKVRVTDKKTGRSYTRFADRAKISELRKNPNISSVEMTGYGTPYEGEKKKGSSTAAVKSGKGLSDKDYDGDGKRETPTAEYKGSRDKAIKKALHKEQFLDEITKDVEDANPQANQKKIDVMKGKNKIEVNPKLGEQVNPAAAEEKLKKDDDLAGAPNPKEDPKEKRVRLMKRQILQKKMQAVRSGAGADIVAHTELEGEVISEKEVKVRDTRRVIDAIRAYDKSKDASKDATADSDEGHPEKAAKERKYAKKERGEIDKDDPNWKKRKYHTGMHGEAFEQEKNLIRSILEYDNTKSPDYDKKKKALAKKHGGADKVKDHPQFKEDAQYGYDKDGKSLNPKDKDKSLKDQSDKELADVTFDGGAAIPATIKGSGDRREIPTAINLIKNKYRAQGILVAHKEYEESDWRNELAEGEVIEGYQRDPEKGERSDTRSAKQKRMDSPDKGINSPAFRKFMADKDKGSSTKKKSAPAKYSKSNPNPQGTLHLSPEERKKREAKRREDLYKRSASMRKDQKKRGVGVYAKGAKNPGADMDKKLGI